MAYIHKETYEILHSVDDEEKKDYFECDEGIAPIISLLNKKGYKTANSCEGHIFDVKDVSRCMFHNKEDEENIEDKIYGYVSHTKKEDGWCEIVTQYSHMETYISFLPYVRFGKYLDTFPYEKANLYNNAIYIFYMEDFTEGMDKKAARAYEIEKLREPYELFKYKFEVLSSIYEWVKSLPAYDDIITKEDKENRDFVENEFPKLKRKFCKNYKPNVSDDEFDTFLNNMLNNMATYMQEGDTVSEKYKRFLTLPPDEQYKEFVEHVKKYTNVIEDEGEQ